MAKKKLLHFKELETFPNVFQETVDLKGRWHSDYFENDHPIVLELACGKGEYTVELARRYPEKNFIGLDIKGARLWRGAKTALDDNLTNVAFLRVYIQFITEFFAQDEVSEIWITFPDPYLKHRKSNKRLTSPFFLNLYRKVLKKDGLIHLKTDSQVLFDFTLSMIESEQCTLHQVISDVYDLSVENEILAIKTFYEKKHLQVGKTIKYICFSL